MRSLTPFVLLFQLVLALALAGVAADASPNPADPLPACDKANHTPKTLDKKRP